MIKGVIKGAVYADVVPRVEYQLEAFGETLRSVKDTMWVSGSQPRHADSRLRY